MKCKICKSKIELAFSEKILNKYDVSYFKCSNCGVLFTEDPYWKDESYSQAIKISDTGLLDRNIRFSKKLSSLIFFNFNKKAKFLDYAGGYGIFTRLMRDIGFDFYWYDPYTQNLLANGFEFDFKSGQRFELLTAFEVFEHLIDPIDEINKMLELSDSIAFSTELIPSNIPDPKTWWYYGLDHGQHVILYAKKTLLTIAQLYKLNYYSFSGVHLFTKQKISSSIMFLNRFYSLNFSLIIKKNMISRTQSDFESLKKRIVNDEIF